MNENPGGPRPPLPTLMSVTRKRRWRYILNESLLA